MFEIHQLVPNYYPGDAISAQVTELQEIFINLGFRSKIWAGAIDRGLKTRAGKFRDYQKQSRPENLVFYHASDATPLTEFFKNLPDKKILVYHNITPLKFFRSAGLYYPAPARAELEALAAAVDFAWGVSDFNRRELEEMGFSKTGVLPIIFNPEKYRRPENHKIIGRFRDGRKNILFVGRIAPNKKIEDLLNIFYFYRNHVHPDSRLIIVGKIFELMEPYYGRLTRQAAELGLELEKDVIFTGAVAQADLVSYYKVADLYLSASEHEGFGVPFLEAMYFEVPIVAFQAAAVSETLGEAGVLYTEKKPPEVAELIGRVISDEQFRARIIAGQKARLASFFPAAATAIVRDWLNKKFPGSII